MVRRTLIRRPEAWLYAVAAAVGVALVIGHAGGGHEHGTPDAGAWMAAWVAMVLAMMLPVIAPVARRVAMRSLWRRRHRAMAWFVLGYLAVWVSIGAALVALLTAAGWPHAGPAALAAALLAAAAWQVARPRRRVMRRCWSLPPVPARGWPAARGCAGAGVRVGLRCVFTCGPVMLALAVGHGLLLMAGVLALLLSERARGPNPHVRAGRPLEAWWLVAFAGFAALG